MLKALLIDDEPLAHEVILHHLADREDVVVVKQCYQAAEALAWLASNSVDLLFLDINMPQLSGMEMLRVMAKPPQVIIISAYQEYALEGFELNVTDYLLKPVKAERLNQAIDKVNQRINTVIEETTPQPLFLKVDRSLKRFHIEDIILLEAYGNYVKLWQEPGATLISSTLKNITDQLPKNFIQIHKSFVVPKTSITEFNTNSVKLNNGRIVSVGSSYKKQLGELKEIIEV